MSKNATGAVYLHVIEDVIAKMRQEFLNQTGDDSVLDELQSLWESKLMESIEGNVAPNGPEVPTGGHDLNMPYQGTGEYETPTADMLFTLTPSHTPIQTPLQVEPVGGSTRGGAPSTVADVKTERQTPNMQHQTQWENQRSLDADVNVAGDTTEKGGIRSEPQPLTEEFYAMLSGKRKREEYSSHFVQTGDIPQQDGTADMCLGCSLPQKLPMAKTSANDAHTKTFNKTLKFQPITKADASIASIIKKGHPSPIISQCDGFNDDYGDFIRSEDYNTPYLDTLLGNDAGNPISPKCEILADDEPPLDEEDDDDSEDGDEEPVLDSLILAQFEKVSRTKNKWKCHLKAGIMRLNDREIVFAKGNGEFDFLK